MSYQSVPQTIPVADVISPDFGSMKVSVMRHCVFSKRARECEKGHPFAYAQTLHAPFYKVERTKTVTALEGVSLGNTWMYLHRLICDDDPKFCPVSRTVQLHRSQKGVSDRPRFTRFRQ